MLFERSLFYIINKKKKEYYYTKRIFDFLMGYVLADLNEN